MTMIRGTRRLLDGILEKGVPSGLITRRPDGDFAKFNGFRLTYGDGTVHIEFLQDDVAVMEVDSPSAVGLGAQLTMYLPERSEGLLPLTID